MTTKHRRVLRFGLAIGRPGGGRGLADRAGGELVPARAGRPASSGSSRTSSTARGRRGHAPARPVQPGRPLGDPEAGRSIVMIHGGGLGPGRPVGRSRTWPSTSRSLGLRRRRRRLPPGEGRRLELSRAARRRPEGRPLGPGKHAEGVRDRPRADRGLRPLGRRAPRRLAGDDGRPAGRFRPGPRRPVQPGELRRGLLRAVRLHRPRRAPPSAPRSPGSCPTCSARPGPRPPRPTATPRPWPMSTPARAPTLIVHGTSRRDRADRAVPPPLPVPPRGQGRGPARRARGRRPHLRDPRERPDLARRDDGLPPPAPQALTRCRRKADQGSPLERSGSATSLDRPRPRPAGRRSSGAGGRP